MTAFHLTRSQKLHLHLYYRSSLVSLADPVAARYLADMADDDMPPTPAVPAVVEARQ